MKLYDYGCGQEAKYQLKNGKWCCFKSQNSCPMIRKKLAIAQSKVTVPRGMSGKRHTEEARKAISKAQKENPSRGMLGKRHTEETNRKNSNSQKENPARGMLGKWHTKKARKAMSKGCKLAWLAPGYQRKQKEGRERKPNKPVQFLMELLNRLYPNDWKYVGDYQFFLGGKNPDFMNVNGKKKLIELFGDYWHRNDDPQDRIDHFKQYGFDILVIWERELKDMSMATFKINRFMRRI